MPNLRVTGSFSPQGRNAFVPEQQVSGQAGAILGNALGSLAQAGNQVAAEVEAYTQRAEAVTQADLQASMADWTFATEQQIDDVFKSASVNQSNVYEQIDAIITNEEQKFLAGVQERNPELVPRFGPRVAQQANTWRRNALSHDYQRKGRFFTDRATEMVESQGVRLENNPAALEQAKVFLSDYIVGVPDEDLGAEAKAALIASGEQRLMSIAYGATLKEELRRGQDWGNANASAIVDKIIGNESSWDPEARNPNSSATGLAQMTSNTWMRFMQARHKELLALHGEDVLKMRTDPGLSREAAAWYVGVISGHLADRGLPVNPGTIYLGYFAGEEGATHVLQAPADASVRSVLGRGPVEANEFLQGMDVAGLKAWAAEKMDQPGLEYEIDGDPRFALLDYETRIQGRADAERVVAAERVEAAKAAKLAYEDQFNELLMDIRSGTAGRLEIEAGIQSGWLTDYDDVVKAERALKKKEEDLSDIQRAQAKFASGDLWNPQNSDDKKALNAFTKLHTEDLINNKDGRALPLINSVIEQTGGTMAPPEFIGQLSALANGADWESAKYALDVLSGLNELHPQVMDNALNDSTMRRVRAHGLRGGFWTEEEQRTLTGTGLTAQEMTARESMHEPALRWVDDNVNWDNKINSLFNGWFSRGPSDDFSEPNLIRGTVEAEWTQAFLDAQFLTGNLADAEELADRKISSTWALSRVGDARTPMKHAPELRYPGITTEEFELQVQEAYDLSEDFTYRLVSDAQTDLEVSQGIPPSYAVVVMQEDDGISSIVEVHNGLQDDDRIFFDYTKSMLRRSRQFRQKAAQKPFTSLYSQEFIDRRIRGLPVPSVEVQN